MRLEGEEGVRLNGEEEVRLKGEEGVRLKGEEEVRLKGEEGVMGEVAVELSLMVCQLWIPELWEEKGALHRAETCNQNLIHCDS